MRVLYGFILMIFLSFVAACSNTTSEENNNEQTKTQQENDDAIQEESPTQTVEPDEEQQQENESEAHEKPEFNAEKILNEYKTTFLSLAQEAENDGQLTSIETKDQLVSYLKQNMSKDIAEWYADTYFTIKNDKIYIKAMDSPTWLDPNQSFEIEKIDQNEYKVIQERDNELLGHVNMTYKIVFNGEDWVVDDIQTKKVETNTKPKLENEGQSENISKTDAEAKVRDHLNLDGNNTMNVKVDHQDKNKYVVHVYEIVKQDNHSHTATLGWYYVYKSDGRIENMMK